MRFARVSGKFGRFAGLFDAALRPLDLDDGASVRQPLIVCPAQLALGDELLDKTARGAPRSATGVGDATEVGIDRAAGNADHVDDADVCAVLLERELPEGAGDVVGRPPVDAVDFRARHRAHSSAPR